MKSPIEQYTRRWDLVATFGLWRVFKLHTNQPEDRLLTDCGYYRAHNKIKIHVSEQQGLAEDLNHRSLPPKVSEFIKAHAALLA